MSDTQELETPWLREIVIDRAGAMPPVEQMANAIRNKIAVGQLKANEPLPSVRTMARHVGTTPATVARTYKLLQNEGLLATSTGMGTTVADIENLQQSARSGILDAADQVLDQAMSSLASLGLGRHELDELLRSRGELPENEPVRLIFIAREHTNLALYDRQLRDAVKGLHVTVHCLPLELLEANDQAALQKVDEADVVTSLVTYKRLLAELLPPDFGVRYIIAEVIMEAAEALSALDPDTSIALIAGERFRSVALGMLHTYTVPERIEVLRNIHDEEELTAIPPDSVVVHTYQHRERVRPLLSGHQLICLDFELRRDSLNRVREFVSELINSRPTGQTV